VAILALFTSVLGHIFDYTVLLLVDLFQVGCQESWRKVHEYVLCLTNLKSSYCLE
jgi:hypothetical protein